MADLDLDKLPHMDIVDMPSDPNGYLGNFRATLRGTYNHNRGNQHAITLIRDTLAYALSIFEAAEKAPAQKSSAAPKTPAGSEPSTSSPRKPAKRSERAAKR